jgi:hypothetical protein
MKRALICAGLGAGLMYLLDPEHGGERRAQLRDKVQGLLPRTSDAITEKAQSISMHAIDLTARADEKAAEVITTAGLPSSDGQGADTQGDENLT